MLGIAALSLTISGPHRQESAVPSRRSPGGQPGRAPPRSGPAPVIPGAPAGHDGGVSYRERRTVVPGAVLWERAASPAPARLRILPDGCLDLLWDGSRLFVAGPDTMARWHQGDPGASYVALRFSGGAGPALLGVPADELRDRTPGLDELWPAAAARVLSAAFGSLITSIAGVVTFWLRKLAINSIPLRPGIAWSMTKQS